MKARPKAPAPKSKGKMTHKKKLPKSASSNPTTKKFREAARRSQTFSGGLSSSGSTFGSFGKGSNPDQQGGLTLEALEKHNEAMGGFTEAGLDQDDATSVGHKTFNTWATNMTGCTNVTFNRVHRYINSNSLMQKEILAVLAAITEVIKEKGGQGSDVQYFAVLVSSLQEAEKTETMTAMAHLLSIVIKKVPVAVLQKQFSQVSKTLVGIITHCASNKEILAPLKPVLSCLASLLRVIDTSTWLEPSTEHVYKAILLFISHSKPKLRKAAQTAVKVVLRGSLMMQQEESSRPPYHPAAPVTAQWCIDTIESARGQSNRVDILHTLSMMKDLLSVFPHKQVKSGCEVLLKLMTLTDPVVRSSCLEVMYRLFVAKPSAKIVPGEMNAQIIMALYDHQPSEKDSQPMGAWLRVMEAAACNLARVDTNLCVSHVPRLFSVCITCLLSDREEVAKAAVQTMKALLHQCVEPFGENLTKDSASNQAMTSLQKIVKTLETGLSYQFHSVWSLVLQLWSSAFLVVGKVAPKMLTKCLTSMGDLRDTPHFSYKPEMDQALGSAVKAMGPQRVLEAIPLGISGENDNPDFPRGWLLPVFRDNVTHTQLGFFTSYFLPLAATFRKKAEDLSKEERMAESKAYDVLQLQIWSLLKGFCDHPTDLKQSFQGIAKSLGTALSDREDLRMDVMSALRSIVTCSLDKEEDKQEVGRFAKNFLPILFNLFTSEGMLTEGTRLAVLETIRKYFVISDSKLISSFLDKSLSKMSEQNVGSFRNIALLDLSIAMIPYTDAAGLKRMFELSLPRLQSEDRTVQKKSYRVLEELCSGKTQASRDLLSSNIDTIRTMLLQSLSKSSPSSKAPRLRCLIHIYKNLEEENMDFFMATLPEAILCTKEIGVKARAAAFELIVVMSETYLKWNTSSSESDNLAQFVTKLLAGLAGSPHMISATLLAITRVVYHYQTRLTGSILDYMVENVCLLLASKTREIIKTALGFIKVLLSAYENTVLAAHLQDLLNGLHEIAVKGNMRRLTKIIYVKLIKKFGYELILSMTKESVHKLLKNIHKSQERAKRKQAGEKEEEEDDQGEDSEEEDKVTGQPESIDELLRDTDSELDDDMDEGPSLSKKKTKKKQQSKGAWLMETGDDEIVDFMDPAAAKQVITTRPKASEQNGKGKMDKDRGFKMAGDGRLIITQDEDDEDNAKGAAGGSDAEEDLDDLFATLEGGVKNKPRKRKFTGPADDDEDEDEDVKPSASKYKAGGSGIHRPIAKAKRRETDSVVGTEYQSKKAAGDMKKKGKPDPYAYVPLNIANLNKRKQLKVKGTFSNLVKGAKKGAAKGSKFKSKAGKGGKGKQK
ncbi:RRP12-like protein [Aplysia californica]|uniref:RRP12-like protein n=1 Tax=Aplysia californica TaxID=6500 RepID=A0ABM0K1C7_APLCA|nr:RRP12-like protein [Aplysia californica]